MEECEGEEVDGGWRGLIGMHELGLALFVRVELFLEKLCGGGWRGLAYPFVVHSAYFGVGGREGWWGAPERLSIIRLLDIGRTLLIVHCYLRKEGVLRPGGSGEKRIGVGKVQSVTSQHHERLRCGIRGVLAH